VACNITITSVTGIPSMGNVTSFINVNGTSVECKGPVTANARLDVLVTVTCGNNTAQQVAEVEAGEWDVTIPLVCKCEGPITVEAFCVSTPDCKDTFTGTIDCNLAQCPIIAVSAKVHDCKPDSTREVSLTRTITSFGSASMVILQWEFGDGQWAPAEPPYSGALPHTLSINHNYETGMPFSAKLHILFPTDCQSIPLEIPVLAECLADCPEVENLSVSVTGCADISSDAIAEFTGNLMPPMSGCSFKWDFGDGSPDLTTSTLSATHTYTDPGSYPVAVLAICGSCFETTSMIVNVPACAPGTNCPTISSLNFNAGCFGVNETSKTVNFDVTTNPPSAVGNFNWNFGDLQTTQTSSSSVTHNYDPLNTYVASVEFVPGDLVCDSSTASINVSFVACGTSTNCPIVESLNYTAECFKENETSKTATFNAVTNPSSATGTFIWNFGDLQTSQTTTPTVTHDYNPTNNFDVSVEFIPDDQNCPSSSATKNVSFEACDESTSCFDSVAAFINCLITLLCGLLYAGLLVGIVVFIIQIILALCPFPTNFTLLATAGLTFVAIIVIMLLLVLCSWSWCRFWRAIILIFEWTAIFCLIFTLICWNAPIFVATYSFGLLAGLTLLAKQSCGWPNLLEWP
jgi:hypothetical protein